MTRIKIKRNMLNEIVRLLAEELITIQRGGRELIYDAQFNADDHIINAIPYNPESSSKLKRKFFEIEPNEKLETIINSVQERTTASRDTIFRKILDLNGKGIKCRKQFTNIESAIRYLNDYWLDAINWPARGGSGSNSSGVGEAALILAFHSDLFRKEPDFIPLGPDGEIIDKFSVKNFGSDGKGSVRSKTFNVEYDEIVKRIINNLTTWTGGLSELTPEKINQTNLKNELKKNKA